MKKFLLLTLLSFVAFGNIFAGVKVVVFSDPHIIKEGTSNSIGVNTSQNESISDTKMTDLSNDLVDEMILKIKNVIKPDVVLVTGDLTENGDSLSHSLMAKKLQALTDGGISVCVVPGNHDIGRLALKDSLIQITRAIFLNKSKDIFLNTYSFAGYDDASMKDPNSLSYVREIAPGLVLAAIDSHSGVVSEETIKWIEDKVESLKKFGKTVFAMMHHPLFPHYTGVELMNSKAVVSDWENVRNRLADAGVRMILTGHLHTSDIATDFNADLSKSIIDVNTGSLATYPCNYRVLEFSDDLFEVNVSTGRIEIFRDGENFQAYAKNRLRESVVELAEKQDNILHIMPSTVADIFMVHVEGNEEMNSETERVLSGIKNIVELARSFDLWDDKDLDMTENMANSVLRDVSNYGDSDRENKTDDLSLKISLKDVVSSVHSIEKETDEAKYYDLLGRKTVPSRKGLYIRKDDKAKKIVVTTNIY